MKKYTFVCICSQNVTLQVGHQQKYEIRACSSQLLEVLLNLSDMTHSFALFIPVHPRICILGLECFWN